MKGYCKCGGLYALTKDHVIRKHRDGHRGPVCDGSGKRPTHYA